MVGLVVHKKLALLFSRKLCLSQWRGSKWRVEGHETRCPMIARKIIIDQSFVIVFFTAKKQLSAYSMFWWGMAVKKFSLQHFLKFSYSLEWCSIFFSPHFGLKKIAKFASLMQLLLSSIATQAGHNAAKFLLWNEMLRPLVCEAAEPPSSPRKCKVSFEPPNATQTSPPWELLQANEL